MAAMISYASNTGTRRNLDQFRKFGWRILLSPKNPYPREGLRFAIDNGAWSCYQSKEPFDTDGFMALVEHHGAAADFVVIPDKVASPDSLEFSKSWLSEMKHLRLILLAVQDGMSEKDVGAMLEANQNMGIFLGGSTEWKLETMRGWGMVAHAFRRHYHVGRVNTVRRIRLAHFSGADSIDGTSGTMFSCTVPKLHTATLQPNLFSPKSLQ